jgi:hypothetical protein
VPTSTSTTPCPSIGTPSITGTSSTTATSTTLGSC